MFLGSDEILRNVKGTFQKFYYKCTIKRTPKTEHFRCFNGNYDTHYGSKSFMFARNITEAHEIIDMWNKPYTDESFKYELLYSVYVKNPLLTISEIIDDFYSSRKGAVISYVVQENKEFMY